MKAETLLRWCFRNMAALFAEGPRHADVQEVLEDFDLEHPNLFDELHVWMVVQKIAFLCCTGDAIT